MILSELIQRVNKAKEFENKVYIGDLAEPMFGLYDIHNYDDQLRLTSYYIRSWHCTDSRVGYRVYFFDDVFVAISYQGGRKSSEEFEWSSTEAYNSLKEYFLTFEIKEVLIDVIDLIDLSEDFGETYQIQFHSQMYEHHKNNALYRGVQVSVIGFKDSFNDGVYHPETVNIKFEDGTNKWVEPKKLDFKYNII